MQRWHETAAGGLFFHCEIANENIEKSVSAEIGAGGWAVEGVSLMGYMRATMDVEHSLMLLGVPVASEICSLTAQRQLSDADTAMRGLSVALKVESDARSVATSRAGGQLSAAPQTKDVTAEQIVFALKAELDSKLWHRIDSGRDSPKKTFTK